MRALLLAAGLGTRLRPLTDSVPKCLVEINGRPLLDYWIELLANAGIRDILINLHHLPEPVLEYIDSCPYPVSLTTAFEPELLGTGGTLLKNRDFFLDEPAMIVHADNFSRFDMGAFIRRYEERSAGIEITMMTFVADNPSSCGIVELDSEGVVQGFHEKVANPPGNLANGAVYIVSSEVRAFVAVLGKSRVDLSTEVLPHYMGRINTFQNRVYHRDIGTPEQLARARRDATKLPNINP